MKRNKYFILTEAAAMLPLVRGILHDVREARARLSKIRRRLLSNASVLSPAQRETDLANCRYWNERLADCLAEAERLGIEITPGVRCEALFPFEHQWIGPYGDGKIRPAYFVYNDAQSTVTEWFFSGWPTDRRKVWPHWWQTCRPGQAHIQIRRKAA